MFLAVKQFLEAVIKDTDTMEILVIIAIEIIGAATFLPSEGLVILGTTADEIVYQFGVVVKTLDNICSIVWLWSGNLHHHCVFC